VSDEMIRSPLHERHVALHARFAPFAGWQMPLQYSGVIEEHTAVRQRVGLFDVSHLGTLDVTGHGAAALVDEVLTNDLGRISPGQAQYTLCCNADGGVLDDLIVYLDAPDHLRLVPNAANAQAVAERLREHAPGSVTIADRHRDVAVLAAQGPASPDVLADLGLPTAMDYMAFTHARHAGVELTVCRTGYTGERGYELLVAHDSAAALWDSLMEAGEDSGIQACGLAARDTLRTEMGYPLHGNDLSPQVTPVQARLRWAVGWNKPEFVGKQALSEEREAGPTRMLRGLVAQDRSIPRPGMVVRDGEGRDVGLLTSGTFSPTLRLGIGLGLLDVSVSDGDDVSVEVRDRVGAFVVTKPPFVQTSPAG
jgi:aminomethyltransferase